MPLTPNSKFNRKALPAILNSRPDLAQAYQAPKGQLEIKRTAFFIEDQKFLSRKLFIIRKIHILDVCGDHLNLFNPPMAKHLL